MIPVGTPVAACSARWAARARSVGVPSNPSASPMAHSSAALDDNPAPVGMSDRIEPVRPLTEPISRAMAAMYRAHAGVTTPGSPATGRATSIGPGSASELSAIEVPPGSNSMVVPRSIAIGNTRPPV